MAAAATRPRRWADLLADRITSCTAREHPPGYGALDATTAPCSTPHHRWLCACGAQPLQMLEDTWPMCVQNIHTCVINQCQADPRHHLDEPARFLWRAGPVMRSQHNVGWHGKSSCLHCPVGHDQRAIGHETFSSLAHRVAETVHHSLLHLGAAQRTHVGGDGAMQGMDQVL